MQMSKYFTLDGLLEPVESGAIAAIKGSWLVALHERGGVIARRQDLPPEAFWTAAELRHTRERHMDLHSDCEDLPTSVFSESGNIEKIFTFSSDSCTGTMSMTMSRRPHIWWLWEFLSNTHTQTHTCRHKRGQTCLPPKGHTTSRQSSHLFVHEYSSGQGTRWTFRTQKSFGKTHLDLPLRDSSWWLLIMMGMLQ